MSHPFLLAGPVPSPQEQALGMKDIRAPGTHIPNLKWLVFRSGSFQAKYLQT